jgi:hypothetical protein
MNEVVPAQPQQNLAAQSSGPSGALIEAEDSEFARKAGDIASSLVSTVAAWDTAKRDADKAIQNGSSVIPVVRSLERDESNLRAQIDRGEAMLSSPMFKPLAVDLGPFVHAATVAQIKHEIAKLLAAFPTKDDLTAFTAILFEEIIGEKPSWLMLAIACRHLRRNSKFRPSIAEVLEALEEADWAARRSAWIVRLPKYVAALKRYLAEAERLKPPKPPKPPKPTPLQQALADCGCYVCPDQEGYSVTDGVRRLAGPFATETEAWSWLEEHAFALCNDSSPL